MNHGTPLDEIRKLPHAFCDDMQGRGFPLYPLRDESGAWHLWMPVNGKLVDIQGVPVEGNYFSMVPDRQDDLIFPFLEFLHKHALWPGVWELVSAITSDLHNLGSSLAKLDLILNAHRSTNVDIRRMVGTEIEYVFMVCRSLFNLLQAIVQRLWERIRLIDPKATKNQLPKSFADMLMRSGIPLSYEEIAALRKIPITLAQFYHSHVAFFSWLRNYRDRIDHGGQGIDFVLVTDKGLAVARDQRPFVDLPIWADANTLPNGLGSATSAVSYIIDSTLSAFDGALAFFRTRIKFPADVVPNHGMFTRGIHTGRLGDLKAKVSKPW